MNKRDGKGKFYVKSSDTTIDGDFSKDELTGGRIIDKEGNIFTAISNPGDRSLDGRFVKGKLFGRVKIDYANGNTFDGYFSDGKKCG